MTTRAILREVSHRPWPLPSRPWIMFQSWRTLLFAHWPVPAGALRPLVPARLELDERDGSAWVGMTPFRMAGVRARGLPAVPFLSSFPEMNLRTYVRLGDRAGVFFFSLDAASRLAVRAARVGYRLPYFHADMRVEQSQGWIRYRSRRRGGEAELVVRYRPDGPVFSARPGTLEHFLTERYALYAVTERGRAIRGEIQHRPWPLQAALADITRNTVPAAHGITLPVGPPLLHFAARLDTLVWAPEVVAGD